MLAFTYLPWAWSASGVFPPVMGGLSDVITVSGAVMSCPMFAVANVLMAQDGLSNPCDDRCLQNGHYRCCYRLVDVDRASSQVAFRSEVDVFTLDGLVTVAAQLPIGRTLH